MLQESCSWRCADRSQRIRMTPEEVLGLRNGEPVMAAVLGGDRMADITSVHHHHHIFVYYWSCHTQLSHTYHNGWVTRSDQCVSCPLKCMMGSLSITGREGACIGEDVYVAGGWIAMDNTALCRTRRLMECVVRHELHLTNWHKSTATTVCCRPGTRQPQYLTAIKAVISVIIIIASNRSSDGNVPCWLQLCRPAMKYNRVTQQVKKIILFSFCLTLTHTPSHSLTLTSEDNNLIRKNFLHRMLFRDIY